MERGQRPGWGWLQRGRWFSERRGQWWGGRIREILEWIGLDGRREGERGAGAGENPTAGVLAQLSLSLRRLYEGCAWTILDICSPGIGGDPRDVDHSYVGGGGGGVLVNGEGPLIPEEWKVEGPGVKEAQGYGAGGPADRQDRKIGAVGMPGVVLLTFK